MGGYNLHPDGTTPSFVHLNKINTKSVLEAALEYRGCGFLVTPLHGKRPVLGRWQELTLNESEIARNFCDGRNIGMVLGGSVGIVDVDLDNPLAIAVADHLLPDTVKSGREKNPRSHYWYLCTPVPPTKKYPLPPLMTADLMVEPGEAMLAELRSTGHLTVVAPSIHPVDADRYLWHSGEICEIDGEVLADHVLDIAIATLLALARPLGSREWFAVHAACYLYTRVGYERTVAILDAASVAIDDEEHDERMGAVRTSLCDVVDEATTIDADIAEELERLAPGVPALIARWCDRERRGKGGGR